MRVGVLPPPLSVGARVAVIAPAGPLTDESELARAEENVRTLGWEPVIGAHTMARRGYLAGTDDERLHDLNAALSDDAVAGVWCARGGYGTMRLLESVDYAALRRHPKALIGFSDITALHAAIGVRCGVVTFHGPTARGVLTPFSRASLARALIAREDSCGVAPSARIVRRGRVQGRLAGGNLALLAALAGTPYAPRLEGALLVLEDVNEPVYRIDRMLTQLRLAGALDGCRALVFGAFTDLPESPATDAPGALDAVLEDFAARIDVPCLVGAPIGHLADQWTLPLGADAELDADARRLTVFGSHPGPAR